MTSEEKYSRPAEDLKNTAVYCINIIARCRIPDGIHWIYFPDKELDFYRISFPKNYFDNCTPRDEHVIAVEVGSRQEHIETKALTNKVLEKISKIDIFDIDSILFTHEIKIPIAYCIYDKKRTNLVWLLKEELEKMGIITAGRYGQWEYSCMEDAIIHGKKLADRLKKVQ